MNKFARAVGYVAIGILTIQVVCVGAMMVCEAQYQYKRNKNK